MGSKIADFSFETGLTLHGRRPQITRIDSRVKGTPAQAYGWCSPADWAIRIGKWLIFHPFGGAGSQGFLQPGVINHKIKDAGHSDYFRGYRLQAIADSVAQLA